MKVVTPGKKEMWDGIRGLLLPITSFGAYVTLYHMYDIFKVHCLYFEYKILRSHMYHSFKILGLVSCVEMFSTVKS